LSVAGASAQTLSPFSVAAPGQWTLSPDVEAMSTPFHRLTYGTVQFGGAIVGNVIEDNAPRSWTAAPAVTFSRGFDGFGGAPAEVYGRVYYI
jgi:hypothetical protein